MMAAAGAGADREMTKVQILKAAEIESALKMAHGADCFFCPVVKSRSAGLYCRAGALRAGQYNPVLRDVEMMSQTGRKRGQKNG